MTVEASQDITRLLAAWSNGNQEALNALMSLVYPELRRVARKHLSRQAGPQTLESAALANEAYLKLVRAGGIRCESRVQFFSLCAQIIRRILVDYARQRGNAKRGGSIVRVPLDEEAMGNPSRGIELLALDDALVLLSQIDPRKGRVVELRYFGGLGVEETAEVLRISPETVKRDWKLAKAWLLRELSGEKARTRLQNDRPVLLLLGEQIDLLKYRP
jgi:RNA polymerase sigma factor (TIGR02999 family)